MPRDGKDIEGPSVRLAEIVANSWGNLRVMSRIIDEQEKHVVAQGIAIDLEKNVAYSTEVRRGIYSNKTNRRYSADMINTTMNAACAIASRNAVFKAVPMAYVKTIQDAAKRIAIGNAQTIEQRRELMLKKFSDIGVKSEQVFSYIGKGGKSDITLQDIENLIGVYAAIDGGDATIEEVFPPAETIKKAADKKTQTAKQAYNTELLAATQIIGKDAIAEVVVDVVNGVGQDESKWTDADYKTAKELLKKFANEKADK
jgi:hypothetical protein